MKTMHERSSFTIDTDNTVWSQPSHDKHSGRQLEALWNVKQITRRSEPIACAAHFSTTFLSCLTLHAKFDSESWPVCVIPKPDAMVSSRLFLLSIIGLFGSCSSMFKLST